MGMDVTQRVRLPTRQDVGGLSVRFSPTGSNLFVCLFAWDSVAVFPGELLCVLLSAPVRAASLRFRCIVKFPVLGLQLEVAGKGAGVLRGPGVTCHSRALTSASPVFPLRWL